jgi:hypothetical protein
MIKVKKNSAKALVLSLRVSQRNTHGEVWRGNEVHQLGSQRFALGNQTLSTSSNNRGSVSGIGVSSGIGVGSGIGISIGTGVGSGSGSRFANTEQESCTYIQLSRTLDR